MGVHAPRAPLPGSVDVAVVGAGFSGLAAAGALARRGARVAVLEAGRVGDGASGRSGGIVLEDTAAGPLDGVAGCIPALQKHLAETDIDCDLQLGGCFELAHRPPESAAPGALHWRDGESALVVEERVPGGTLDPGALLSGLLRAALDAGASVHERTPVRSLELGADALLGLGDRAFACDAAVLGLNGYTPELIPDLPGFGSALTLALCTEPDPELAFEALGLAERTPFYTADLPYLWGRALADGRLVFGAGLAFAPDGSPRQIDVACGEAAQALVRLESRVRDLHPVLKDVRVATRWGGPVAFREGRRPLLARLPSDPRVIVTGAYAGHGVALSVRAGLLAAAAISGDAPLPAWGAPNPGS